jgi:hypothetical protein
MKTIPLTQGLFAVVDDEDFDNLSRYKWQAFKKPHTVYAARTITKPDGSTTTVLMHREILSPASGVLVDHADGDGLNNRRNNLRVCNRSENARNSRIPVTNSTGYKGVSKQGGAFRAYIRHAGRIQHLGRFKTAFEAARAYDAAATKFHGEFARTNLHRAAPT